MLLSMLTSRLTPENPQVPLGSDAIFDILGGTGTSSSGVKINGRSILSYPAVWRGINLISSDVGKLEFTVKRFTEGTSKVNATSHPAYRLLRRQPNVRLTSLNFRRTLTAHALTYGNGYAWIQRNSFSQPKALIPLDPVNTTPARENGRDIYATSIDNRDGTFTAFKLLPDNVLHIRGLGFDGWIGYSIIDCLKESLGLGIAMQSYGSVFFKNNARPSVVIEMPGRLKDEEAIKRLRESWGEVHAGINNAHRPAILESGATVKPLTVNNEDAQLLQSREFEIRQVANIIGVPPHKLADSSRTAYNTIEAENTSYLQEGLDSWLCAWETECEDKLLTDDQKNRESHCIEFDRDAIVRVDTKTKIDAQVKELNAGTMTINEARAVNNRPPLEGFVGDAIRIPLNHELIDPDADELEPEQEPPPEPVPDTEVPVPSEESEEQDQMESSAVSEIQRHIRTIVERTSDRMINRLSIQAQKAAAKSKRNFEEWLVNSGGLDSHRDTLDDAMSPIVGICAVFRETADPTEIVMGHIKNGLSELITEVPASELHHAVRDWMGTCQSILPRVITRKLCLEAT